MDTTDRLAIHELLGRYGHIVDSADFSRLGEVFTDDAEWDCTAIGSDTASTLEGVKAWFAAHQHPPAHLTVNVVVTPIDADSATVMSKWLVITREGAPAAGVYKDVVVRTGGGWKLKRRAAFQTSNAYA
jgi:hypothetical protein